MGLHERFGQPVSLIDRAGIIPARAGSTQASQWSASRQAFDRVLLMSQRASLAGLAEAFGWEYRLVSTRGELEQLLTVPVEGPTLVEVPLGR